MHHGYLRQIWQKDKDFFAPVEHRERRLRTGILNDKKYKDQGLVWDFTVNSIKYQNDEKQALKSSEVKPEKPKLA